MAALAESPSSVPPMLLAFEEAEAEFLSSSGMAKSETGTRINRMINRMKKLLLKLKKEGSRDQVAILRGPLKELEKFEKKKTSMEAVKGILFDAAVAVKKYKKFWSAQK